MHSYYEYIIYVYKRNKLKPKLTNFSFNRKK